MAKADRNFNLELLWIYGIVGLDFDGSRVQHRQEGFREGYLGRHGVGGL